MDAWTAEDIRQFLQATSLFAQLPAQVLDELTRAARVHGIATGEEVMRRGESGDSLFVVASGQVRVTLEVPRGVHEVSVLGSGDFFGEIAMMTRAHRTATVTATSDAILLEFDGALILRLAGLHPALKNRLARTGAQRSSESLKRIIEE